MDDEKTENEPPVARGGRLEPWRPAFAKILLAIRKVQKLEDGR